MTALPVDARRIGQCVSFHAAREPEREAAVHGATRIGYRDLDRAVTRWARALLGAGVTPGDRVASLTAPSADWLAIMLGTTEIGAIWTGCHPRYRMPEFRRLTQLAEPTVLIALRRIHGRDYAGELTALVRENPSIRRLVMLDEPLEGGAMAHDFLADGDACPDRDLDAARHAVGLDDTAVLIFTSGTTGQPKAAMITHRALLTGAAVENEHWPMDRPRLLHMMPVNHIAGVGMVGVFGLYIGGTLVFQDRFDAGDWLLAGYFRDPRASADACTADGWFRTGDVVKVWPDGNLEIVGRTREMFISGGFNIFPREVEIVIEAHPEVGLVAVLGVPDETFGEVGHAFVEPKPGKSLDAAALREWCRERLANYKTPKRFETRAELPRLPIGKIDKQALKRELAERTG